MPEGLSKVGYPVNIQDLFGRLAKPTRHSAVRFPENQIYVSRVLQTNESFSPSKDDAPSVMMNELLSKL